MALQTANQFQLGTDFSRLGSGVQQGQQIANQFQIGKQNEQKLEANAEESRIMSVVQGASEIVNLPDDASKLNALYNRKQQLIQQGKPTQDTDEVIGLFEAGDIKGANGLIQGAVNMGIQTGRLKAPDSGLTAEQREFKGLTEGLSEADELKARRVKLRIDPPASLSADERIALDKELSLKIADAAKQEAAAKETGKLTAQLNLKPEVEAAVVSAVAEAKLGSEIKAEDRTNQKALDVYNAAKTNLMTALGGTITGPGAGWIPALTANAQIANGAVAMMAPVLKQLFRSAGEGTFTDQDQKMLIAMVPTRDTLPEARTAQLAAIDAVVSAKLGKPSEEAKQKTEAQNSFTSSTGINFTVQ